MVAGGSSTSGDVNLAFTGPRNGTVNIDKFDITPDGGRFRHLRGVLVLSLPG